jgi:hypothetical protein
MTMIDCGLPWLTMDNHVSQLFSISDHEFQVATFGIVCQIMTT